MKDEERKRAEEILNKHNGPCKYYTGIVQMVPFDVAIDAMQEFASQSLPSISEEEIIYSDEELKNIYNNAKTFFENPQVVDIVVYSDDWMKIILNLCKQSGIILSRIEGKAKEDFTQRLKDLAPTDEWINKEADEYSLVIDEDEPNEKRIDIFAFESFREGMFRMREKMTGILIKKEETEEKNEDKKCDTCKYGYSGPNDPPCTECAYLLW